MLKLKFSKNNKLVLLLIPFLILFFILGDLIPLSSKKISNSCDPGIYKYKVLAGMRSEYENGPYDSCRLLEGIGIPGANPAAKRGEQTAILVLW